MKHIQIKLSLKLLILFSVWSCVDLKQKEEEQIKDTVTQFWKAVEKNDLQKCNSLIEDSETFNGIIQSEIFFLHDNYSKINTNNFLYKNMKIKDTTGLAPSIKLKYVQYYIRHKSDSNNTKKPLIITFLFYKEIGYIKILNPVILENYIDWGK